MAKEAKTYYLKLNIGATTDGGFKDSINSVNGSINSVKDSVNSVTGSVNAMNDNLLSSGIQAHLIASGIKKAFSFIKDTVAESIEVGKEFEKTLDTVQSISKASVYQMEDMHDASLKLGSTTAFSANESAEALQFMSQAGWTADKSLTALKAVTNLAAAGDIELANAAEITTDNINAFKLEAKDAGRLADALATGANKSSTNVTELGTALQYAAPKAGAMGYTVEDTVKVLGHLADVGIKGQKSGTALRAILANISKAENDTSKKGTEASRALKALGVSMFDAKGKAKPLSAVIEELRVGFSKLKTDKEVAYYADVLGGKVASNALIELAKTSKENIEKLNNAFKDTKGAAEEMAEIRMDNLSGDMKKLSGYAETLNIKLYDGMLPYLRESAQVLRENLGLAEDKIPTISKGIGEITLGIAKMSKPAMEMMSFAVENREILGGLIMGGFGGKALVDRGVAITKTLTKLKDTITDFKDNGLKDAVKGSLSFGKVGLIVALSAAVIGGIVGIKKHFDRVAKDKNIKEHFGDIALSLEQIDKIAKDIVYQGNIEKIHGSFKMFEELDKINDGIDILQNKQHKLGLKIKAGIELTEEEKEEFIQNAKDTVSAVQEYFEQNKISILEFTSGLSDSDLGKELSETLIAGLDKDSKEAEKIGQKWVDYINKAMEDGIISNEELLKIEEFNIDLIKMQKRVERAGRESKLDIEFDEALEKGLSKESLENLNQKIMEELKQSETEARKTLTEVMTRLKIQKEDGGITEEKYNSLVESTKEDLRQDGLKRKARILERMGSGLYKRYEKEFKQYEEDEKITFLGDVRDLLTESSQNNAGYMPYDYNPLSSTSRKVIKEILGKNDFKDFYSDFKNDLKMFKPELTEQLNELYTAVYSDIDVDGSVRKDRLKKILNNPERVKESYKYAKEKGFNINEQIARSIDRGMSANDLKAKLEKGGKEAEALWLQVLKTTFEKQYVINLDVVPAVTVKPDKFSDSIKGNYSIPGYVNNNRGMIPMNNADGGIYSSPILTYVAEGKSAEAIIPLDKRPRSKRLLELANEVMGYNSNNSSNNHIVFSPIINVSGNADKNDVVMALKQSYAEFENNMSRYLERNARVCL